MKHRGKCSMYSEVNSATETRPSILFVDDDDRIVRALQRAFKPDRTRWDIVFCVGGVSASAALKTRSFDVVVTDLEMSDVDGRENIALARRENRSITCIVVTGAAIVPMVLSDCVVLAKPASMDEIRRAIVRAIAKH